jgi:hypothetical protein
VTITLSGDCPNCAWRVDNSQALWVRSNRTEGTGPYTLTVQADANPTCSPRTGNVIIAGQSFSVTQAAGAGTFTISATNWAAPPAGGSLPVTVNASSADCTWSVVKPPVCSWLTVTPLSGSGQDSYTVTVQATNNTTGCRSCNLTIAGNPFTVNQGPPVALTYLVQSNGVVLSWPGAVSAPCLRLFSTPSLSPPVVWTQATEFVNQQGDINTAFVPCGGTRRFYALCLTP